MILHRDGAVEQQWHFQFFQIGFQFRHGVRIVRLIGDRPADDNGVRFDPAVDAVYRAEQKNIGIASLFIRGCRRIRFGVMQVGNDNDFHRFRTPYVYSSGFRNIATYS